MGDDEERKPGEDEEDEFEKSLDEAGEEPQGPEPEKKGDTDASRLLSLEGDRYQNDSKRHGFSFGDETDDIFETTDLCDEDEAEKVEGADLAASDGEEAPAKTKRRHRAGFIFLDVVLVLVIALCVFLIAFNLLFTGIYVVGSSMSPTLTGAANERSGGGDYVYLNPRSKPEHGDIVVVWDDTKGENIIKRVVALEGDTVEIEEGVVCLNGEALEEDYVAPGNNTMTDDPINNGVSVTLGPGEMYLLGDNRDNSSDSRSHGPYRTDDLLGVVSGWALSCKGFTTGVYTFFNITLPGLFGLGLGWRSA